MPNARRRKVRRGRPARDYEPVEIFVKFVLHPEHDADLVDFFAAVPARRRAAAVKAAMRSGNIQTAALDDSDDDAMGAAFGSFLAGLDDD